MIIKRRESFYKFNMVINTVDFLIKNPEYNPFSSDTDDYLRSLKDKLLQYSMIHYQHENEVSVRFTEQEYEDFYVLYGVFLGLTETDKAFTNIQGIIHNLIGEGVQIEEKALIKRLITLMEGITEIINEIIKFKEKHLEIIDGTDYVRQLQDKYTEWLAEKEKKDNGGHTE